MKSSHIVKTIPGAGEPTMSEKIELGDHTADEPRWFIINHAGQIGSGPYDSREEANRDSGRMRWFRPSKHSIEYGIQDDDSMFVDAETGQLGEDSSQVPERGNNIRTKKNKMEGKVDRVDNNKVFFRLADGRLMKTSLDNVIVIEKLADEDDEMMEGELNEISTELLGRYKTAAGKQASTADKAGDYKKGEKRFGGIVKATKKQFANDAKKGIEESSMGGISPNPEQDFQPRDLGDYGIEYLQKAAESARLGRFTVGVLEARTELQARANGKQQTFAAENDNPVDTITVDVPLLIRIMEYAKEDAKTDLDLHNAAERLIKLSQQGRTLTMDDYESIVSDIKEGTMGGINRSAPANDVSYQDILNDVTDKWKGDTVKVKESGPLKRVTKAVPIIKRQMAPVVGAYGDRLDFFLESINEADFTDILNKQHADSEVAKKKPVVDIDYHGWKIRYRPASVPGAKVDWMVLDKKGDIKNKGVSLTDKDAVSDAEEWVKSGGGGTSRQATTNVTVDFNAAFSRQFAPAGETFYATIESDGNTPVLIFSTEQQQGFKTSHSKPVKNGIGSPVIALTPKECNDAKLQPNGRYVLGDKDQIDDNTVMFPLIFQSVTQSSNDKMRMGQPGITVAAGRSE